MGPQIPTKRSRHVLIPGEAAHQDEMMSPTKTVGGIIQDGRLHPVIPGRLRRNRHAVVRYCGFGALLGSKQTSFQI
jgi:hypothetical protein